jgi:hypothetical protein
LCCGEALYVITHVVFGMCLVSKQAKTHWTKIIRMGRSWAEWLGGEW